MFTMKLVVSFYSTDYTNESLEKICTCSTLMPLILVERSYLKNSFHKKALKQVKLKSEIN